MRGGIMAWDTLADRDSIDWAISALNEYGMNASLVQTGAEAREKVLSIIPASDEVMNMTSMTLTDIGLDKDIMESGRYQATRNALAKMDRKTQELEMQRLGAAPPWAIGSVHAVTEDGSAMLASKTGSQMAAYVYGALKVIWVVGAEDRRRFRRRHQADLRMVAAPRAPARAGGLWPRHHHRGEQAPHLQRGAGKGQDQHHPGQRSAGGMSRPVPGDDSNSLTFHR
jgi:hypothetical protein